MRPPQKIPTLTSNLAADAMYFYAARQAFEQAVGSAKHIDRARRDVEVLQAKIDRLSQSPGGEEDDRIAHRNYSKLEPLYIQMEGTEYRLGEAYGPMLQNMATVHILCASSAEAHINIQGQTSLHGREWATFERLPVDAKWLFLPKLLGLPGFDPGKQPLQGFDSLLHIRNKLVHFKPRKEPWRSPGVPDFLSDLGLSPELGERSLQAVEGMITEFARQLHQEPPHWLGGEGANFFEVTFED